MNEKNYFTKELQQLINELSDDDMKSLLLELEATTYWTAILRYTQQRMQFAQNGLYTMDPIAKATEMCRTQGILMGQTDLQNAVISLKLAADKNTPVKDEKDEI